MRGINRRVKSISVSTAALFLLIFSFSFTVPVSASGKKTRKPSNVKIKNFGQVDERLYRGGQPDEEDFQGLAALGVTTVVNLVEDPKSYEESAVKAAGMRYINIPMSDKQMPQDSQVSEFLKILDDAANSPIFVHCAGGRHRTGVLVAVYRFNHYKWNLEQAYSEMKDYDFYTRWGHGPMKDFVVGYYSNMQQVQSSSNPQSDQTSNSDLTAK